ncbi:ergothioneine biosynthesis protein EgtB [Dulcicalothrix desertica PCC 7102]|uniref:Ergothioneine biosynthesis protein EgtB n=1 Tax=Dulcicalothrix desertica PCC 7102 TaxID=232991 RepID=A0A3S1CID4_9CYAN|nr:ergothioneine biosynthesis protein EgtB [Dulcicalothrix desertica]RUT07955.1 ergothioneine biosynthesis protein EgtB [Dulcicalothrix desertica PCC 7102]TWH39477.1 ergothioneine biosynthesis protein EgtB [Dulcicalothrix desertica PCC 7102]
MILNYCKSSLKDYFIRGFQECRTQTLELLDSLDEETFRCLAHPDFSPVGWHLGHIAYTESLWLLERGANQKPMFPQYRKLYAADGLPKSERVQLPTIEETRYYLNAVREKVLDYLKVVDIEPQERLWRFLLQHESQHCETACIVLKLINYQNPLPIPSPLPLTLSPEIKIPRGEFEMGSNSANALDNERAAYTVYLDTYFIDRYPITSRKYRDFMESGGYKKAQYWSDAGWEWLQHKQVNQPLYWCNDGACDNHPVMGVSYYEAEAYAKFVGKRLPTEAEWEKAARWDEQAKYSRTYPWGEEEPTQEFCNCAAPSSNIYQTTPVNAYPKGQSAYGMYDALGNVWEWTNTWFDGYKGFEYYPYIGYSQVYFDNKHKVLKGSSWATRPMAMRASFRNWYYPHVRQIFAGFRCASN